jgi:type VI secretion system protein ImpG
MSLKQYYEKELSVLQDEAHQFSKQFPEHAASLNMEKNKVQDPNVARLLEGCAFLTAKIHQMVDEEADHLPEQLIQRLWPQLAEAYPSHCIVQATPQNGLTQCMMLPAGTALKSIAVGDEKTICQFMTVSSLMVAPLQLIDVTHRQGECESISFTFQTLGKSKLDSLNLDSLDIYIDTKISKAQAIIQCLLSKNSRISICVGESLLNADGLSCSLPALDSRLIANSQQILLDVFCFPEKLQWIRINGLNRLKLPEMTSSLTITVILQDQIDHAYQFSLEDFKLFCVPAINCFEHDAEPILLDHKHHRYPLAADHHRPDSMHVLSVISACGLAEVNHSSISYQPLHRILSSHESYFVFQPSGHMSFSSDKLIKQTVSIKARVCNHHYPRRYLRSSSLKLAEKTFDSMVKVTNNHQPSAYFPYDEVIKKNHLLQILRVQIEHIHSDDHLKLLLTLMNRSKNEAISLKINSINHLKICKRALIKRGVFHHVHSIVISLDEAGFTSISDRFVFGLLLHAYFQSSSPITTIIETTLKFYPSESTLVWLGDHG